jgi:hypothetical protein
MHLSLKNSKSPSVNPTHKRRFQQQQQEHAEISQLLLLFK